MSHPDNRSHSTSLQRHRYIFLAASAIVLILIGTFVFSALEDWSYVDALYFSVVTTTTVGFGDLTPSTDGAKLFTVFYVVIGLSIVGTFLDARMKRHASRLSQRAGD